MADTSVAITSGAGTAIDTRTEGTNGNHRQVVVLGDPSSNAGVAPVDATNGLAVDNKTLPPGAATSANQSTIAGYLAALYQTSILHGVKTVTTAGTPVALAASTACKRIVVQSQTDNTGLIAVGGSGVDATEATGNGIILYPGDSIELAIDNLADVFINSTVNGDGVRFIYFT